MQSVNMTFVGRVTIFDSNFKILAQKYNAVHPQNMATLVTRSLARDANGTIFKMAFGNGGTFVNSSGQTIIRPPNTIGAATLYNQTYEIQVDEQAAGTPETSSVVASRSPSPAITSVVTITAQLASGEPNADFTWDEIGLKTEDDLLLSHLVFEARNKTVGEADLIVYELLVSVA